MNNTKPTAFPAKYAMSDDEGGRYYFGDAALVPAGRLTDLDWITDHYGVEAVGFEADQFDGTYTYSNSAGVVVLIVETA